jgi:small-conductance mechanosensitive channel/CRP-like cAMP-binding protein
MPLAIAVAGLPALPAFAGLLAIASVDEMLAQVAGVRDPDMGRELVVALVALATFFLTAPRGRRWLAWGPALLLLLAPLPLAVAALFPDSVEAPRTAAYAIRFFLLGSLLQSVLLVGVVSGWERVGHSLPRIFLDVLRILAVGVALLAILFEAGVKAENIFAGSAVITAVVGFALKETLGNVFAGLAIHAEEPFAVGDWIQYDANQAHIGRVVEINWRATKVITLDEAFVIIPNGQLAQASIRNFTKPEPWSRRSLFVMAPYEAPPQRVQEVILDAIRGSFGVLEHPPPSVVTNDFKDRGVEYWVRLFTTDFDKRDRVDGMARDRIWYALARHGITIPVATQDIRFTQLPAPQAEPPEAAVERRVASLRSVEVLAALSEEQLRKLAREDAERLYAAGEPVIRQGDRGSSMFVVLSGRVEVTARREPGTPAVRLAELGPGEYFGEMTLLTGAARVATVTAVEQTRLLEVCRDTFRGVIATRPDLVERLGESLRVRLAQRTQALSESERAPPEAADIFQRIRDFFSMDS